MGHDEFECVLRENLKKNETRKRATVYTKYDRKQRATFILARSRMRLKSLVFATQGLDC